MKLSITGLMALLSPIVVFWSAHVRLVITVVILCIALVAAYVVVQQGVITDDDPIIELPFK